jgi:PKD repeat protein
MSIVVLLKDIPRKSAHSPLLSKQRMPTEAVQTNANGSSTKSFTIVITEPQPPAITTTTTTLPNGEIDVNYNNGNTRIEARGYDITWSLVSGSSLPLGLELNDHNQGSYSRLYIYGTPTQTGTYTFTVKAENAKGSVTKEFIIEITKLQPPVITITLPNGEVDVPYEYEWDIQADISNITSLSIVSGSLPQGLELHDCSEYDWGFDWFCFYIYGTPTQTGTSTFTVEVENAAGIDTKELTIAITEPQPVIITTTTLPNGEKGTYYETNIDANVTLHHGAWLAAVCRQGLYLGTMRAITMIILTVVIFTDILRRMVHTPLRSKRRRMLP